MNSENRNRETRRFSFSFNEFDEADLGFTKLLEACNFDDLPRVRAALMEFVEAHRENKQIVSGFSENVQDALEEIRDIQPRHADLASRRKQGEPLSGELAELNSKIVSLVNTIGEHRPFTERLRVANEQLGAVLFLTPKAEWRKRTGRDRPKNLSELKQAMAAAGYGPEAVHANGLTPRFAEDFLL